MKEIYLLDDLANLKKILKKIKLWHPKAKIKIVTELEQAIKATQAEVVVVSKKNGSIRG